jgi:hypothetical protein
VSPKTTRVIANQRQVDVLRSVTAAFGEPESKARALALLESRSGFPKWYQRHYGYPLDPQLTVTRRARRDGTESVVAGAAEAAGIAGQPVLLCSLIGLSETTLKSALLEAPAAPPLLLASVPLSPLNIVLHWDEYHLFTFSSELWARLRMSEAHWSAP